MTISPTRKSETKKQKDMTCTQRSLVTASDIYPKQAPSTIEDLFSSQIKRKRRIEPLKKFT